MLHRFLFATNGFVTGIPVFTDVAPVVCQRLFALVQIARATFLLQRYTSSFGIRGKAKISRFCIRTLSSETLVNQWIREISERGLWFESLQEQKIDVPSVAHIISCVRFGSSGLGEACDT